MDSIAKAFTTVHKKLFLWRRYQLDLDTKDWNKETVGSLHDNVVRFASIKRKPKTEPKLKIIFIGQTGSGKSSLINSFRAALTSRISNLATEGGRGHTTVKFCEIPAFNQQNQELDLAFYDVRGTDVNGSKEVDLLKAILGKKKIGEKFVPGEKYEEALDEDTLVDEKAIHVIIYVMDASTIKKQGEGDQWQNVLLDLKDVTDKWNLSRYLVLTHMDMINPNLKENIKLMHTSYRVKKVVQETCRRTQFPEKVILPVVNPVDATHEMDYPYRTYFLYLLWAITKDAKENREQRLYERERKQQQSEN